MSLYLTCVAHGLPLPCATCGEDSDHERLKRIQVRLDDVYALVKKILKALSPGTSALTLSLPGGTMSVTVGSTGTATLQFSDPNGDPGPGPDDTTTGAVFVPVVTSANPEIATIAAGVAGSTPGEFTYEVTGVAVGTYEASVEPLVDAEGTALVDSAGNAYTFVNSPASGTVASAPTTQATLTLP